MSGRLAVDTNAFVHAVKNVPVVVRVLNEADQVCLPVSVLGEIIYGALNSTRKSENLVTAQTFIARCAILPVTTAVAYRYAQVRSALRAQGRPIPENDLWIAAICLEHGLPLLSRDAHFQYVDGLEVRTW